METTTTKPSYLEHADKMSIDAMRRYEKCFDSKLYLAAIKDHEADYNNQLIDTALALCGSPRFRIYGFEDPAALEYLALFCW